MKKQNRYRFNLSFDEADEDHRRVCDYLNACGRKKARFIVKAILAYWALQEGKYMPKEPQEGPTRDDVGQASDAVKGRVINLDDDYRIDPAEAALMKQNYAVFDDME